MASAEKTLGSARKLHASTKDDRSVYYLTGLAVEQALNAIRFKQQGIVNVPAEAKGGAWHDPTKLAAEANLTAAIVAEGRNDGQFGRNWLTVRDWKSNSRYPDARVTSRDAQDMLTAVSHAKHGVMKWLRNRYETI